MPTRYDEQQRRVISGHLHVVRVGRAGDVRVNAPRGAVNSRLEEVLHELHACVVVRAARELGEMILKRHAAHTREDSHSAGEEQRTERSSQRRCRVYSETE